MRALVHPSRNLAHAHRRPTRATALGRPRAAATVSMALTPLGNGGEEALNAATNLLLAYTDDSTASLNTEIGVISFAGAAVGLTAVFLLLTKNLQAKSFSFVLDEVEQAAVDAVSAIFDPTVGAVCRLSYTYLVMGGYERGVAWPPTAPTHVTDKPNRRSPWR